MRTPFSYYGGKQQLAKTIVRKIPEHMMYVEPFFGGGAVFWAKEPSKGEVINDTNRKLMTFYEIVQSDFLGLEKLVEISLHSRDNHRKAQVIYDNPDLFDKTRLAWAVWILANESYASKLNGSYGWDRMGSTSKTLRNRRESFSLDYAVRLQDVEIESVDALRIIRNRDGAGTFFYVDPPYIGTDCGHYDGYSKQDYQNLLDVLTGIEGKFLLSSFPNRLLDDALKRYGWRNLQISMRMSVTAKAQPRKMKTEMLVGNYDIDGDYGTYTLTESMND